jgi:hypothetical protein
MEKRYIWPPAQILDADEGHAVDDGALVQGVGVEIGVGGARGLYQIRIAGEHPAAGGWEE